MRTPLTFITVFLLNIFAFGQSAMTFNEAKEKNISSTHLDSIYPSGIHSDISLAVFKSNQEEYILAYQKLLQDLGKYLKENNFMWSKPTKGFNRIYFNSQGKIDYFIYSFRPDQLTIDQEKRFGELLKKFIIDYRFPLIAKTGFAQCSPVTYMP